ncbi:hypothetical protein [Salinimicrobium sp. GXAS 041]|uniref:hypothetical protein n=1 Tax=Salinimicrobium sp. GXAS 041 TaxID=3400806 RepID=UPI003C724652
MKLFTYLITGTLLLFLTAACNQNKSKNHLEITGTIQEQGITSYQYGTHTLTNSETFYAVRSDSVNLNDYLNEEVTVMGQKISGYPLDGGPEYLEILEIK